MSHVLVVDDNDTSLLDLSNLLKGAGFDTVAAHDGREALSVARRAAPDAVISDLLMPVMDGYTLLREMKADACLARIPFVIYTATYTDPEDERLALDLGANAFILKPQEPADLLKQLGEALRDPRRTVTAHALLEASPAAVKEYNAVLVRKLEEKCMQVEQANRALREEVRQRTTLAATKSAILDSLISEVALINAEGYVLEVNRAWRDVGRANGFAPARFGVGTNYLQVCDRAARSGSAEAAQIAKAIRNALHGRAANCVVEYASHTVDREQWFEMTATPYGTEQSAGAVVMHVDITERKMSETAMKRSLAEKQALLQEVHHRVKNNLTVISSLLALQASTIENLDAVKKLHDSERRVRSMAMIHEQLYQHDDMSSINLAEYVRDLAAHLFSSFSPEASITYRLEAKATHLTIGQAIPCGLILNELLTNALKYAYPDGNGEIVIRIGTEGNQICMTVADQGVGLPAGFGTGKSESLGMKIIEGLTGQLDGHLEIGKPPGASFTVRFPKRSLVNSVSAGR